MHSLFNFLSLSNCLYHSFSQLFPSIYQFFYLIYCILFYKLQEISMQAFPTHEEVIHQTENTRVEEHYASIIQFKKNQMKINLVLALPETGDQEKQQLEELKQNIEAALEEQMQILKEKEKKHNLYPLSLQLLTVADNGKLTKCFLVEERKWKNAEVLEVDVEEQTAKIKRYGQEQEEEFPAFYLKVLNEPDAQLFAEGTYCKAIYSGDGQFYPCVIEKIEKKQGDTKYIVRYKKYNTTQSVPLHRLRPMQNPNQKKEQIKFESLDEFKVPEKLKIQPNDPQNVKKAKKNKIKAMKFAFKNAKIEEASQQKKSKWQNWNQSSEKVGHFKTKYDLQVFHAKNSKK